VLGVYEGWGGVARTLGPSEGGDAIGLEERVLLLNAEPRLLHTRQDAHETTAWKGVNNAGVMRRLKGRSRHTVGATQSSKPKIQLCSWGFVVKATSSLAASMYLAAVTRVLPCGWGTQIKTWTGESMGRGRFGADDDGGGGSLFWGGN
jgi:hypothetical protein